MNASVDRRWFAWRTVAWIFTCTVASILVATLVAASQSGAVAEHEGASPYTPTKGEWLCLFLNTRQALINSELARQGVGVHYFYELSKPDVLQIDVLFCQGVPEKHVKYCVARAEHQATNAAKVHGWQKWLKTEIKEQKVTELDASDVLMR